MVRRTRPNRDDYRVGCLIATLREPPVHTLTECALRPLRGSRKVSRTSLGPTVDGLLEGVKLVPSIRFRETPHPILEGSLEPRLAKTAAKVKQQVTDFAQPLGPGQTSTSDPLHG